MHIDSIGNTHSSDHNSGSVSFQLSRNVNKTHGELTSSRQDTRLKWQHKILHKIGPRCLSCIWDLPPCPGLNGDISQYTVQLTSYPLICVTSSLAPELLIWRKWAESQTWRQFSRTGTMFVSKDLPLEYFGRTKSNNHILYDKAETSVLLFLNEYRGEKMHRQRWMSKWIFRCLMLHILTESKILLSQLIFVLEK